MIKHDEDCECCQQGWSGFLKNLEIKIKQHGHTVVATEVPMEAGFVAMAYTVGLADAKLSELIVFGLPPEVAVPILDNAVNRLRQGDLPLATPVTKLGNAAFIFHPVPAAVAELYVKVANGRAGKSVPVIQMFWPDTKGRFPWEAEFEQRFRPMQPMLHVAVH